MLVTNTFELSQESLNDHAFELAADKGISIKKQSLHSKFSPRAVQFLKTVIQDQMKAHSWTESSQLVAPFTEVFIQDSTRFELPSHLKDDYPGLGGIEGAAGQIQFVYGVKHHKICQAEIFPSLCNESRWSVNNEWLQPGALVLRDLGYFTMDGFQEIIDKGAYFISRAKPKTAFYTTPRGKKGKLDIGSVIKELNKTGGYLEKELTMGFDKKLPVRVIFNAVSGEVKAQRLRKAHYNAKTRNWNLTKEYKAWAGLNIYITNLPKEKLPASKIPLLYRIRWQIELVFKSWKSLYKFHLHKKVKKERIECYLYAALLQVLLHWKLFSWFRAKFLTQGKLISLHKFTKTLLHLKQQVNLVLFSNCKHFFELIQRLGQAGQSAWIMEKKKSKTGLEDLLIPSESVSLTKRRKPGFSKKPTTIGLLKSMRLSPHKANCHPLN